MCLSAPTNSNHPNAKTPASANIAETGTSLMTEIT